jgi:ribonuclease Z
MRRTVSIVVGVIVLLATIGGAYLVPSVQDALIRRAAEAGSGMRNDLVEKDAMRVLLCGSRGPLPHPMRAETCVAVFAGGRWFVVDTGAGSWNNLALWRVPGHAIGAVFLSHLHSDHIGELGELNTNTWIAGRGGPLRVYGPVGVQRVVHGFNVAYELDRGYRFAHHGPTVVDPRKAPLQAMPIPLRANGATEALVFQEDGVRVMAFLVDHDPATPALGFRFDYGGRSVVISGDTVPSKRLVKMSKGADLLVHEALAAHMLPALADAAKAAGRANVPKIMADIPDYHTTPVDAAKVANEAGVGALLLYHLVPAPRNDLMERVFMRGVDDVRAGVVLGDDGTLVTLPVTADGKPGKQPGVVQFGRM